MSVDANSGYVGWSMTAEELKDYQQAKKDAEAARQQAEADLKAYLEEIRAAEALYAQFHGVEPDSALALALEHPDKVWLRTSKQGKELLCFKREFDKPSPSQYIKEIPLKRAGVYPVISMLNPSPLDHVGNPPSGVTTLADEIKDLPACQIDFKRPWDDDSQTLTLYKGTYDKTENLAIGLSSVSETGTPGMWSMLSVNIPDDPRAAAWCQDPTHIVIDSNDNSKELIDALIDKGVINLTGQYCTSGFCSYPLATVNQDALSHMSEYQKTTLLLHSAYVSRAPKIYSPYAANEVFTAQDIMNTEEIDYEYTVLRTLTKEPYIVSESTINALVDDVRVCDRAGITEPTMTALTIDQWHQKAADARWALDFENQHGTPPTLADFSERNAKNSTPSSLDSKQVGAASLMQQAKSAAANKTSQAPTPKPTHKSAHR